MIIVIGCNNENGMFTGKFEYIMVKYKDIEIDLANSSCGPCKIEYYHSMGKVIIGRMVIKYKAYRTWPGSWCCDEIAISRKDGIRILKYLVKRGFTDDMIIGSDSLKDAITKIDYAVGVTPSS